MFLRTIMELFWLFVWTCEHALCIWITELNAQTKGRSLDIKMNFIEQNKHFLSHMETWECHQMKIIKGKWSIFMLFLTFVTPLLGWKMAVWFSVARRWPNIIAWCAFLKSDTAAGLTRSLSLKCCIILVCLRNFNYEISVVWIWRPALSMAVVKSIPLTGFQP